MGFERENERAVADYLATGAHGSDVGRLGLEVEHHVLFGNGTQVAYEEHQNRVGVKDVLEYLATWYPQREYNAEGDLIGLAGPDGTVTLEPAAQLEFSVAPYGRVAHIERAYMHFRERVATCLAPFGASLVCAGYNPKLRAQELELIPKRRYGYMNDYFAHIGSYGDRMMRGSASTQVSVDFADEADAVRKMRISAALAPILAAIADDCPVFEGQPNHVPIRRLQLWREVDSVRCGTPPRLFEDGFGFSTYVDWLFSTSPIFVTRRAAGDVDGPTMRAAYQKAAREVYADAPMDPADVEHLLSMFWPDVRLKRFVEVRPADCMPSGAVLGYVALIKGLFYSEESLSAIERELGVSPAVAQTRGAWPMSSSDVEHAIGAVQAKGFAVQLYGGRTLCEWESLLFTLARASLDAEERTYLPPLEDFAQDKPWWVVGG